MASASLRVNWLLPPAVALCLGKPFCPSCTSLRVMDRSVETRDMVREDEPMAVAVEWLWDVDVVYAGGAAADREVVRAWECVWEGSK